MEIPDKTKHHPWKESAKLCALCALVPHVPRTLRALVPHVPRALRASCLTCPRASRALCLTCSRALRASCPTCSRASRASCPTCSHALRALMPYMPHALRALLPHVPRALCAPCPTCLVSYADSCLVLHEPFFLTYPIASITLKLRSVFINNMDITELFETKYENIYIRNCKLYWHR